MARILRLVQVVITKVPSKGGEEKVMKMKNISKSRDKKGK